MFNKPVALKASEINMIKEVFPKATLNDMFKLKSKGTIEDITECRNFFPDASMKDVEVIVGSRSFVRWCGRHKGAIAGLLVCVPTFAMKLFGLELGSFALSLFTHKSTVAYGTSHAATVAYGGTHGAVAAMAAPAAAPTTVPTNFFGGKGAILLHMLIVGFLTLVVSSFLKFTGRGDLIPLVMFIGGAVILYEVIGLFTDIYTAIKTMFNM